MMTQVQSPHISDDLPRLLTGDATRDEVMAAAEHLRTCPDCQHELVGAVVAHASLTSAYRFAEQVVVPNRDEAPPAVPDAEAAGRHAATAEESAAAELGEARSGSLPDLSSLFAQIRADSEVTEPEADQPAMAPAVAPVPQARPHHRRRWIAAGLAAAVIAGGGVTAVVVESNTSQPAGQTVALSPIDVGKQPAKMTISGSTLKIDASKLTNPGPGKVYEVWLVDEPSKTLTSIGTLGTDNKATLTVTPGVRSHYSHVQVSVQNTNDLKFSNVSVLRGDYR
jgi:hypothetical protein